MAARGRARHAAIEWDVVVGAPRGAGAHAQRSGDPAGGEPRRGGTPRSGSGARARGDRRDVRFGVDTRMAARMRGGFVPDYSDLDPYVIRREAEAAGGDRPRRTEATYTGLTESPGIRYIDDSGGGFWSLWGVRGGHGQVHAAAGSPGRREAAHRVPGGLVAGGILGLCEIL